MELLLSIGNLAQVNQVAFLLQETTMEKRLGLLSGSTGKQEKNLRTYGS